MGPGLPSNYATNHFAWAQDCPKTMLLMFTMSVAVMLFYATDNLFWAQHMPRNLLQIIWDHYCPECVCCAAPNVLLIVLHGPSHYHKLCCPVTCMGPDLHQTLLLIVFHGPGAGPKCAADCLAWAYDWFNICCQ